MRGSSHIRGGLPNQDACEFRNGERSSALRAVLAVADGHGGARHFRSQVGSALAANTAVNILYDSLEAVLAETGAGLCATPIEETVPQLNERICAAWRTSVLSDLGHNPFSPEELTQLEASDGPLARQSVEQDPLLAYGATLLATAVTDTFILYLQLGDGDILTVSDTGETSRPIPPDARLVANQTTSLCLENAPREFRFTISKSFPALVLVATDGYANSFRSDEDFLRIGADYLEIVRKQGIDVLAEELPGILSGASQEGSGDDITLGVLQRMGPNGAAGTVTAQSAVPSPVPQPTPPTAARVAGAPAPPAQSRSSRGKLAWIVGGGLLALALAALWFLYVWPLCCAPAPVRQPPFEKQQQPPQAPKAATTTPKAGSAEPSGGPPKGQSFALVLPSVGTGRLELQPGDQLIFNALHPEENPSNEPYASVHRNPNGDWELVNLGPDTWTVQKQGRKSVEPPVNSGASVILSPKLRITFRDGTTAVVELVPSKRKPSPQAAPPAKKEEEEEE